MYLKPYIWAINPLVRGTVASQREPMVTEKMITVSGVIGIKMKIAPINVRPRYIKESKYFFDKNFLNNQLLESQKC